MAIPFQYESEYKRKLCTPDEAARVVKSGDWLDISMGCAFPSLMDAAIAKRKEELYGVKIRGYLIQQPIQMVECDPGREHFIYNSWHMSGYERKLCDRGMCSFNPMVFRNLGAYYQHFLTVNVAMMCVTPMNQHGYFNFSLSNASARAVLDKADIVILEINENLPWVYGLNGCEINIADVDMVVEGGNPPVAQLGAGGAPTEVDTAVANLVVPQIPNGACLQLGIGGMPNTIGSMIAQSDLKDLSVHTEMYVDGFVDMAMAGKITGKHKQLDKGRQVFAFAAGTQKLYDYMDRNPDVMGAPVDYTNDVHVISQIDNFISINNAIDCDLFGQVNAESAGIKHISGTGGQLDFAMGAYLSKGGKSFICMSSTVTGKDGTVKSRIVPTLTPGSICTDPRSCTHYIVTEYGMVNLKGLSTWQRAEALIGIAHPDFREQLIADAEKMHIWRRSNK